MVFYSLDNKVEIDKETLSNIELNRSKSERELTERKYLILIMFQQAGIALSLFLIPFGVTVFQNLSIIKKLSIKVDKILEKSKEKQRKNFSEQLVIAYPDLSTHEVSLCEMLHENLTTKDIAVKLNIAPASVNTARYRLRKKMNVPSGIEISVFLRNI